MKQKTSPTTSITLRRCLRKTDRPSTSPSDPLIHFYNVQMLQQCDRILNTSALLWDSTARSPKNRHTPDRTGLAHRKVLLALEKIE